MSPTVLLIVYGQLIMKWRVGVVLDKMEGLSGLPRLFVYLKDPYVVSAFLAAFLGSVTWMFVLEKYDISKVFPMYIGLIVLLVAVGSVFFFKESMTLEKCLAIVLIISGVAMASRVT